MSRAAQGSAMLDWYQAHQSDIQGWIAWGLYYDAFRKVSALM
jgi:hypothetical protein